MKAIVIRQPGGLEALELAELPRPEPGPGQARVKACAIGVGRPDVLMRTGRYKWMPPLPAIPGNELAGVVDALGPGVHGLAAGQRVLLSSRELPQRGGGYAEYACAPAEALYPLPDAISFDDAVSLPNFQLAQALLFGCGAAAAVRSVLLTGAAGGVASAMVQTARGRGLQVIATANSPDKRKFVLENGAHAALDPRAPDLPAQVMALTGGRGVDLAVDAVGAALFIDCLRSLAPLGLAVSYNIVAGPPSADVFAELRTLLGRSLAVRVFSMHSFDADTTQRRALMQAAIDAMASGAVRAPRATVLPLDQARRAHELLDAPDTVGKLVLHP
ncbi:zinc-dependent alcohol dehydrogenase family protein [Aquabacterium sp.]|uniref:zinc-dependent alcohol dehydrogenase family protein n=1 Tax=Aquabacterium sp. TaxID=1872578 RepID=UPI002CE91266|nr:zinc-dependent alcohol dehydrogenase family protein [Aquabacterium sp.]HSW08455.1 zinc-dependent alcohol dehydrogenase family protein [Aquabacterium sp.]